MDGGNESKWTDRIGILVAGLIGFAPTYFVASGHDEDTLRMLLASAFILLFVSFAIGTLFWRSALITRVAGWCVAGFWGSCVAIILPYHRSLMLPFIVGVALLFLVIVISSVYLSWRVRRARSNQAVGEQDQSAQ